MVLFSISFLFIELGEFQFPILVLSTSSSTKMDMETDSHNKEIYIRINQNYKLKTSDSLLTELNYDNFNRLDRSVAEALIKLFISW